MKLAMIFLAGVLGMGQAKAADIPVLYDGRTATSVTLDDVLGKVVAPAVVVVSEQHDHKPHQDHQVEVMEYFQHRGDKVSVGMEFLEWPTQKSVDEFLAGTLKEADFLTAVAWGGNPFDDYRRQVLFPAQSSGWTVALNAPRTLTRKISKTGLASLTADEQKLLPAGFTLGNSLYRERFEAVMGGHVAADAIDRYFQAQSTWDETMADRAVSFLAAHKDQILVAVVGDFHAAWGGGLPDRLIARGAPSVTVISQFTRAGLTQAEFEAELKPHPRYGARARAVWVDSD